MYVYNYTCILQYSTYIYIYIHTYTYTYTYIHRTSLLRRGCELAASLVKQIGPTLEQMAPLAWHRDVNSHNILVSDLDGSKAQRHINGVVSKNKTFNNFGFGGIKRPF